MVVFEQVSGALDQAIEKLDIPVDGGALTRCFELLDRFQAKVTTAVGEFDRSEGWKESGATSMTAWLRHHARRSHRDAANCARTARRLAELPVTAGAYRDGSLSGGQVQAIVANLNDKIASLFAAAEDELIPLLAGMEVRDVSAAMQTWAQAAKDSLDEPEPKEPGRSLHLSRTLDGRRELSGSLDPEAGALAEVALRLAQTPDSEAEPERTPARRRADALVDILRFFVDHQTDHRGGRHRPHLNVFVDYDDLVRTTDRPGRSGWLADGTVLDAATIRRLACDAGIHRIVRQGRSTILDYGMTTRTVPANLWSALVARDQHCRHPGCDRPPEFCDGHHVPAWEHGGPTSIETTILECTRHHHLIHQPGWHNKLLPDGTYIVTNPTGQTFTTHPPGQQPDLFNPRPP